MQGPSGWYGEDCQGCSPTVHTQELENVVTKEQENFATPTPFTLELENLPTPTPFTESICKLKRAVTAKKASVIEYNSKAGHYRCQRCNAWVNPFFDYIEAAGPGLMINNGQGIALFRPTTTTEKRVRCKECGSIVYVSAEHVRDKAKAELHKTEQKLKEAEGAEKRWQDDEQSRKRRAVRNAMPRRRWSRCLATWAVESGLLALSSWCLNGRATALWSLAAFLLLGISVVIRFSEPPRQNSMILRLAVWLPSSGFVGAFFYQLYSFDGSFFPE